MALDLLFLNGELISESDRELSVIDFQDRAFHYGDGIFETIRIHQGEIPMWGFHLQRMQSAQQALKLPLEKFFADWFKFAEKHLSLITSGCAKLIISRGVGPRGYKIPDETRINWWLKISDLPEDSATLKKTDKNLTVCQYRLSRQPVLAGLKHLNRLDQIMARSEWGVDDTFDEGLMLNCDGNIIECTMSNVLWREGGKLFTPDLSQEGVDGCVRRWVIQHQLALENAVQVINDVKLERLINADAVYICNSLMGLQKVTEIDGQKIAKQDSVHALDVQPLDACLLEKASMVFDQQYTKNNSKNTQVEMHD